MPPSSTARIVGAVSDPTSCDVGYKYLIGFADLQSLPARPLPRLAEATRTMYRSRKPSPTSSNKQQPGQRPKPKRLSSKRTMLSADRRQQYFTRQKSTAAISRCLFFNRLVLCFVRYLPKLHFDFWKYLLVLLS